MSISTIQAQEDAFKRAYLVTLTKGPELLGYVPRMEWHLSASPDTVDNSRTWVHVTTETIAEEQDSLSNGETRLFVSHKMAVIRLFFADDIDTSNIKEFANAMRDAYRAVRKGSEVVYTHARLEEVDDERVYFRCDVLVEYTSYERYTTTDPALTLDELIAAALADNP